MDRALDQRLGDRLAAVRRDVDMTQAEAGLRLGISQGRISKLETGTRRATFHDVFRLSSAYGRDLITFVPDEFIAQLPAGETIPSDPVTVAFESVAALAMPDVIDRLESTLGHLLLARIAGMKTANIREQERTRSGVPPDLEERLRLSLAAALSVPAISSLAVGAWMLNVTPALGIAPVRLLEREPLGDAGERLFSLLRKRRI